MDESPLVIRSDKSAGNARFARLDNAFLQDGRLSFRARGVLAYVLSQPDDWSHSAERLAVATTEGEKAIVSALSELEEFGYSWLEKHRGNRGTVFNRRRFRESPRPENGTSATETLKQEVGHRPTQNRPPVDRPPGEGGVYETTIKKRLSIQQATPAAVNLSLPGIPVEPTTPRPAEKTLKTPRPARPRDPLFDALARTCNSAPEGMTPTECKACGVALSEIRKASPDLTPSEIDRRAESFRRKFPNASVTPNALKRHWSALAASTHANSVRVSQ
jgi:hypothetical protein